jgi:ATP-dependent Lhr-like helicase
MGAEDLIAHIFPDQIACQENLTGRRDAPDHPLVNQTIDDCLTEAMDIDELIELIEKIEKDKLTLVAKHLREPSPFAQEIINARPYAFLDDAPFEERRTNAIRNRSWSDPSDRANYSLLDAAAIERVCEQAWPYVNSSDELHAAIFSLAYMTEQEFDDKEYSSLVQPLLDSARVVSARLSHNKSLIWVATESVPRLAVLFPMILTDNKLPEFLVQQKWEPEEALREIVRGRLEGLGRIVASDIANELGVKEEVINAVLLALEVEGFVFQGQFTPCPQPLQSSMPAAVEWCELRLLQRIHRYPIDAHRKSIKPVSLEVCTEFLFDRHQLISNQSDNSFQLPALDGQTQLQNTLGVLDGIAEPAAAWESELYPARIDSCDPGWLDVMCISGRVAWGRYSLPAASQRKLQQNLNRKRSAGPIKSTPISLVSRQNTDIWQALANALGAVSSENSYSALAAKIEIDLEKHGASFFDQVQTRSGLLKTQREEGSAELVHAGRITSGNFTGLHALLTPNSKKSSTHRRRHRGAMFGVEDAGRWSLLNTFSFPETKNQAGTGMF